MVAIASLYTIFGFGMNMSALEMTAVSASGYGMGRQMLMPATWSPSYAVLVFLMWWVMMIAMMVPSAAPTVLLHAALTRKTAKPPMRRGSQQSFWLDTWWPGRASAYSPRLCNGRWNCTATSHPR